MIVKYNDNDTYSSPVPTNNGTIALNNGTVAKKMGTILPQIFAIPDPFFGGTNQPLHPFLPAKSTVLHY